MAYTVLKYALVVAAVNWWVFVIWYTVRSKWWQNRYGRNLANVGVMIASLFTTLAWVMWSGWDERVVYPLVAVILWSVVLGAQRTYFMELAQRE